MKKFAIIASIAAIFGLASAVAAHQPVLTMGIDSAPDKPIVIDDYVTSQAFYGELDGSPDYYSITISKTSDLYLGILAPDSGQTDFTVSLSARGFTDDLGAVKDWERFYEEFAGDWYLRGPEKTFRLIPETYIVTVSSPSGKGKYALAVGTEERITAAGMAGNLSTLPRLKTEFFGQPAWKVFDGKIFRVFAIIAAIAAIVAIIAIAAIFARRRRIKLEKDLTNI